MSVPKTVIRSCLLYEFKQGSKVKEATEKIRAVFGENCLSERTCRNWFSSFESGDFSISDKPRSGRPLAINDGDLMKVIEEDSSQSLVALAETFQVAPETIRLHLHRLGRRWKLSVWVPHELSEHNMQTRLRIAKGLLSRHRNCRFFDQVVTCDEKWLLYDNRKRSHHWLSSRDEPIMVAKPELHQKKVLLCIWWSTNGIIHYELLPSGKTITKEVYCAQLRRVSASLAKLMPAVVNRKGVIFHQDNARPHTAKMTLEVIKELRWELLPHPPYSPDMAPSDYHLFLSMDNYMRNRQLKNRDDVECALRAFLRSKSPEFYKRGIYQLENRWTKVIEASGNYFPE